METTLKNTNEFQLMNYTKCTGKNQNTILVIQLKYIKNVI
jgi:hypothetical protein